MCLIIELRIGEIDGYWRKLAGLCGPSRLLMLTGQWVALILTAAVILRDKFLPNTRKEIPQSFGSVQPE